MSQERTEPYFLDSDEAEQLFLKFFVENSTHMLTVRGQQEALADLLTARREIDRLNATIAGLQEAVREQTAKVQERDKLVNEHAANSYAASEACESISEKIERLNIVFEDALKILEANQMPTVAETLRAALKGAE